jgi:hypothetical protein
LVAAFESRIARRNIGPGCIGGSSRLHCEMMHRTASVRLAFEIVADR